MISPESQQGLAGRFPAWEVAALRRYFSLQTLSLTGGFAQSVMLPIVAYRLEHRAALLGWLAAAQAVPLLLLQLSASRWIRRLRERRVVLLTQGSVMCGALALAGLSWQGRLRIAHLVAFAVLSGGCTAFDQVARQVLLSRLAPAALLQSAVGLNSATANVARVLGPALALFAIARLGASAMVWVFLLNGLSFLPFLVEVLRLPAGLAEKGEPRRGGRFILPWPGAWGLPLIALSVGFFALPLAQFLPALAELLSGPSHRDTLATWLGVAQGVGGLVGALSVAHRVGASRLGASVWGVQGALALGLLGLSIARGAIWGCLVVAVAGWAAVALVGLSTAMVQELADEAERGPAVGAILWATQGGATLGSLAAGLGTERAGLRAVVTIAGVSVLLLAPLCALGLRRLMSATRAESVAC